MKKQKKELNSSEKQKLLKTLAERFEKNMKRHQGLAWEDVQARLEKKPAKLATLFAMEESGGEPDVVAYDKKTGEYTFFDCSAESPAGRRSLCYDQEALEKRKENKPKGSAMSMAEEMGAEMLDEEQYRQLQQLGSFDTKTSSWILTPPAIRKLGGAVFCDRRYDHVFLYHNGAESYYAARGFRTYIKV